MPEMETESKLVSLVEERYESVRDHRRSFDNRAMINYAQYVGKHFSAWNPMTQNFELRLPRKTTFVPKAMNLQYPMVMTLLAKGMMRAPRFDILPATREMGDVNAARCGEVVLDYYMHRLKLRSGALRQSALLSAIIFGFSFVKIYWDPNAGSWLHLPDNSPIKDGDISACCRTPLQVSIDPMANTIEEADWMMEHCVRSVAWIGERYPNAKIESEQADTVGTYQLKMRSYMDNRTIASTNSFNEIAMVKEYWEAPTRAHPEGRVITTCRGKLLDYKESNPYGYFPYVKFSCIPAPERFEPLSPLQMTKPAQDGYNMMVYFREEYLRKLKPFVVAPKGTLKDTNKISNVLGQVVEYEYNGRDKPNIVPIPPMPPDMLTQMGVYQRAFQDVSGINQITMGNPGANIRSADQLNASYEIDAAKFGPLIADWEVSLEECARKIIQTAQQFVAYPKIARLVGKVSSYKVVSFTKADLQGEMDVRVVAGSMMPFSLMARLDLARQLYQSGYYGQIGSPESRRLMQRHIGDDSEHLRPFEDESMAQECARQENGEMDEGKPVQPPAEWEPDDIHLFEHNLRRNMPDYKSLPDQVRMMYALHIKQTEENKDAKMMKQLQKQISLQQALQPTVQPQAQPGAAPHGQASNAERIRQGAPTGVRAPV